MAYRKTCPTCNRSFTAKKSHQIHCDRRCWRLRTVPHKPMQDLFWNKVQKTETCWIWRGGLNKKGYGLFRNNNITRPAHRIAYELQTGIPVPRGMEIHHKCKVRACVRADHMEVVTHTENIRLDLVKTHCLRGHPLVPDNLWFDKEGARYCKACDSLRGKAKYAKHRDKILKRQRDRYARLHASPQSPDSRPPAVV